MGEGEERIVAMTKIYYKSEMERLLQDRETYILGNNLISEYKEELQELVKKL